MAAALRERIYRGLPSMPPPISEKKQAAVEKVDNRSRNFIVKAAALRTLEDLKTPIFSFPQLRETKNFGMVLSETCVRKK